VNDAAVSHEQEAFSLRAGKRGAKQFGNGHSKKQAAQRLEKLRKKQSLNYRTRNSRSSPERLAFPMAAQTVSLLRFGLLGLAALRRKLT